MNNGKLQYMVEAYVDDYIVLTIPTSREQLIHVSNSVMGAIHTVFLEDSEHVTDPISYKKVLKLEGMWALEKDILGFTFDRNEKTIWLEEPRRTSLLTTMKGWLRASRTQHGGIPFTDFQSVIAKLGHVFIIIPNGKGLLSPMNAVMRLESNSVYLH